MPRPRPRARDRARREPPSPRAADPGLAALLSRALRLFSDRAAQRVRALSLPSLRLAHATLLNHLGVGGLRLTDLAERVGVSKQAVGGLVQELEAMGVVRRVADPRDGRAKLVRVTPAGRSALRGGLAAVAEIEGSLAASLGPQRFRRLLGDLSALGDELSAAPPPPRRARRGKPARPLGSGRRPLARQPDGE
ncbi:MAG TPA: MarR family transcriptional regulator [Polyangiaceae bacterium]|nr:MarR family transcriptional regulator [Polyangiaceae bacterium]